MGRAQDLPQVTRQGRAHMGAWGTWCLSLHPSCLPEVRSVMALGSRLVDERHGAVGRVEHVERAAGTGCARVPQGHLGRGDQ